METDPHIVSRRAGALVDENWRFRTFLLHRLRIVPARVTTAARRIGREAESAMDCTTCAACCRDNTIPVNDAEAARIAAQLRLSVDDFQRKFLTTELDGEPAIDATPCPLLDGKLCRVYDARPDACRGYPYVCDNISAQIVGQIERAADCPIVFEWLERLKDELGFIRP